MLHDPPLTFYSFLHAFILNSPFLPSLSSFLHSFSLILTFFIPSLFSPSFLLLHPFFLPLDLPSFPLSSFLALSFPFLYPSLLPAFLFPSTMPSCYLPVSIHPSFLPTFFPFFTGVFISPYSLSSSTLLSFFLYFSLPLLTPSPTSNCISRPCFFHSSYRFSSTLFFPSPPSSPFFPFLHNLRYSQTRDLLQHWWKRNASRKAIKLREMK